MNYLDTVRLSYRMFKLKREIQKDQKEIKGIQDRIASRKEEMLGFAHRIGCSNINRRHIEYLFDNVETYPSRVSMLNWVIDKHIEVQLEKESAILH